MADGDRGGNEHRKTAQELLKAIDDTIETGPWDKSVFLGAIGKKLKDIRFNFKNRLRFLDPNFDETESENINSETPATINQPVSRLPAEGQMEAFVSLYSADGNNLQKWEKIILALDRQIVTRPVYSAEKEIKSLIRSKIIRKNDAYVSFILTNNDIITPKDGKSLLDRLGNPLLILKDSALTISNITRFCHESGVYSYHNNTLTRIGDMDYSE